MYKLRRKTLFDFTAKLLAAVTISSFVLSGIPTWADAQNNEAASGGILESTLCENKSVLEVAEEQQLENFVEQVQDLLINECPEESAEFQTKRLIVKSEQKIADDTAKVCISGYNNLYVFQYDTVEATKAAYDRFENMEGIIFVQEDEELSIEATLDNDGLYDAADLKEHNSIVGEHDGSAEENDSNAGEHDRSAGEHDRSAGENDSNAEEHDGSTVENDNSITTNDGGVKENESGTTDDSEINWGISVMNMESYNNFLLNMEADFTKEIIVAIVDTGIVESASGVFEDRVLKGTSFTYLDGIFTPPVGESASYVGYLDDNGHGTSVAGIVAQSTPANVKILPIKSLDAQGSGSELAVYTGILYAIENGASVINLSCGASGKSYLYEEVMGEAEKQGVTVVVAAGNEKQNVENISPASIPSVFTVTSINNNFQFSSFSNYGSTVDFTAPGEKVSLINYKGGYRTDSGTSFSAPLITSVVAELLCANPEFTNDDIYNILKSNALDLGPDGWDEKYGYGWIDMETLVDDVMVCFLEVNGDANNDGEVDVTDALFVLKTVAGETEMDNIQKARVGVTGNNEVTISQALAIMNLIVGKTDRFM